MQNFELVVVSQLQQFAGKTIKPYFVEGIDSIGVWGDEPFELQFRNRTNQKVQVRLSLDGTDVATGKPAHTNTSSDGMWVVDAYGTLSLKAWVETTERGRSFVFSREGNSVALHTHGDMSNKGIIAAAVYTEGYVAPVRLSTPYLSFDLERSYERNNNVDSRVSRRRTTFGGYSNGGYSKGSSLGAVPASASIDCFVDIAEQGPAVGAGVEVMQKIGTAAGLIQPRLDRVIRMRYMWWDDLEAKLVNHGYVRPSDGHPSGFPGDRERPMANLGSTPTIGSNAPAPRVEIHRFA